MILSWAQKERIQIIANNPDEVIRGSAWGYFWLQITKHLPERSKTRRRLIILYSKGPKYPGVAGLLYSLAQHHHAAPRFLLLSALPFSAYCPNLIGWLSSWSKDGCLLSAIAHRWQHSEIEKEIYLSRILFLKTVQTSPEAPQQIFPISSPGIVSCALV